MGNNRHCPSPMLLISNKLINKQNRTELNAKEWSPRTLLRMIKSRVYPAGSKFKVKEEGHIPKDEYIKKHFCSFAASYTLVMDRKERWGNKGNGRGRDKWAG